MIVILPRELDFCEADQPRDGRERRFPVIASSHDDQPSCRWKKLIKAS